MAQAGALARRWDAHLVGVYVMFKGVTPHPSVAYARSEKAIAGVMAHEQRVADACECTTAEVGDHFRALCDRLSVSGEFRPIHRDKTEEAAIINSLHSDLLIIGHPEPNGLPDDHVGREDPARQRRAAADHSERLEGRDDRRAGS